MSSIAAPRLDIATTENRTARLGVGVSVEDAIGEPRYHLLPRISVGEGFFFEGAILWTAQGDAEKNFLGEYLASGSNDATVPLS